MNDLSHMDLACIHLTDFFRFSIWVTQLHGLWILFPSKKKESVRAQLARIVMANPGIMDYLPEDSKDFVHDLGLALTTTAADAQRVGCITAASLSCSFPVGLMSSGMKRLLMFQKQGLFVLAL